MHRTVASLATYPKRRAFLKDVVSKIAPQVDLLNVVLNQYEAVPEEILGYENVDAILPDADTKDTGKFYVEPAPDDLVFYVDDDITYPDDFIEVTRRNFTSLVGGRYLAGYHCSTYRAPSWSLSATNLRARARFHLYPSYIARFRTVTSFDTDQQTPMFVDQVATNAAVIWGRDAPPYAYMKSSQKFVDVRLAKWCWENGIDRVSLPRTAGWISEEPVDESIFMGFTNRHHNMLQRRSGAMPSRSKSSGDPSNRRHDPVRSAGHGDMGCVAAPFQELFEQTPSE